MQTIRIIQKKRSEINGFIIFFSCVIHTYELLGVIFAEFFKFILNQLGFYLQYVLITDSLILF